ncbi:EAL domain-containing protein [Cohaesibacter haloalkalitolerans]|uniref:EAL domain-containing protein n=1 Tax=Cohaesibacter haloalkalitolerans TaxID=1162980 RepID=UPI000E64A835|nr:EAL domain-containing protein [Cohaesibacter haloalkalitolerans]
MQRLGAVFIAICMVAISASVGAMLHFKFGLSITEASPFSFGVLLTLLLVHYQISRVRDRLMLDEQMDDMTRLKLSLTKEVQEVRDMARQLNASVAERLEKEMEPFLAELDVIGTPVKQLAESCAELDDRVQKGDRRVAEVNAQLIAATSSVKQLEEHLRASARSLASRGDRPAAPVARESVEFTGPDAPFGERLMEPTPFETAATVKPATPEGPAPMAAEPAAVPRPALAPRPEKPINPQDETDVRRALALGHIELFMQPIVSLPMRKPQFYEALTRLKTDDDRIITPDIFLPVCRKNNFLPMLDRLAINEAFRLLRRLTDRGHAVDLFCNLSLDSLADVDFFNLMRDLFDQNRDLSSHVILEFSQADMRSFGLLEDETLKLLTSMGFRFSVDRVTNLAAGFDDFAHKGVKFAKIAAPILTHREAGRGLDIHPADFSRLLSRKGIELIVTHVESERDLVNLIDFNIHLAQGNHFAPAKALKAPSTDTALRGGEQSGTIAQQQQAAAGQPPRRDMPPQLQQRPAPAAQARTAQRPQPQQGMAPTQAQRAAPAVRSAQRPQAPSSAPAIPAQSASGLRPGPNESSRTLGQNPRIAEALRAMAAEDGNNSETRDQFRTALAEAAGLLGSGDASEPVAAPRQQRMAAPQPRAQSLADRLPASDDFGLQTGTDRGQYIEI